jgi:hypothetical protein
VIEAMPSKIRFLLPLLALLLFTVPGLLAQSNYGGVRGLAKDAQGAVVAGATVTLTDEGTGIARTAVTSGAGEYIFNAVDPGTYSVTISIANFRKITQNNVIVTTGVTATVDVTLVVGAADQIIEVDAQTPLIDTASASNGQTFDEQKLQTLPNMGRNPFLFSKLDNNVTFTGDPRFVRFQDQSGSSALSIAGGPTGTNNYLLDGIPITDSTNRAVIIPSLEATQEMKLQANTFDAEMGRTGGGMFNTTLKSGSNTYHGTLMGLTRQTNWTANTWTNNHTAYLVNGAIVAPQTPRQAAEWYSYAGSLGGPVRIPWLNKGVDKTFFWIAEEGYRQRSPLTSGNTPGIFPTTLERAGDFSQTCVKTTSGTCTKYLDIFDPYAGGSTRTVRVHAIKNGVDTPNVIPAAYINSIGKAIVAAMPVPNVSTTDYSQQTTYGNDTLGDRADEFSAKLDHQVTKWWAASASYLHYGSKEPSGNRFQNAYATSTLLYRKVDAININSTFTLSPTLVVTSGWGFNRFPNESNYVHTGFDQTSLGFTPAYVNALPAKDFPTITMSGGTTSILGGSDSGPSDYFSRSAVFGIAKSRGTHSLKAGYVFRSISNAIWSKSSGNGAFTFNGQYTSNNGQVATRSTSATNGGSDVADVLLGVPISATVTVSPDKFQFNTHYHAVYVQDDWRMNQRLTVNLGLRYEYEQGFHEAQNHLTVGFDPLAAYTIGGKSFRGGAMYAGTSGYKNYTSAYNPFKLAPRLGFAYGVTSKTFFRGGFGVFFAPSSFSATSTYSPGYAATTSYAPTVSATAQQTAGFSPLGNFTATYPSGILSPSGNSAGTAVGAGGSLSFVDPNRRSPFVYQYSSDLQQELPYGFALKIGYVGAHARNLANSFNLNQLQDRVRSTLGYPAGGTCTTGVNCLNDSVTNPVYVSSTANGVLKSTSVSRAQSLLPYPQFTSITYASSLGGSSYNSLAVKLQKRVSQGLTMMATYTWASSWDNLWGASSSLTTSSTGPQDTANLGAEWARSTTGIPRRATINGTYELPFGRGRKYLAASRLLDILVGGWNYNHVLIVQSGSPLSVTQTSSSTDAQYGTVRPSFSAGKDAHGVCSKTSTTSVLSVTDFAVTGAYQYGNVPRTLPCLGPGYFNSDISVNKTFSAYERVKVQFRAEALNAFNTVELAAPANTISSTTAFGQITSQIGFNRLIQMGGRITF